MEYHSEFTFDETFQYASICQGVLLQLHFSVLDDCVGLHEDLTWLKMGQHIRSQEYSVELFTHQFLL